jgi:5-methylcytosine-specific restriction endonuclease McrA
VLQLVHGHAGDIQARGRAGLQATALSTSHRVGLLASEVSCTINRDKLNWSTRQGRHPNVSLRLAKLLKQQRGRCRYCGLCFQHDDRIEVDHINGNHHDSRFANLQALHGYCHNAKTREHRDYLPRGVRDKHQDTEERREAKVSCSVLKQREAERSASRL